MTNIAIAHKDYDVRGGGEYLAEQLAAAFDCPLYVGNSDESNMPDGYNQAIREIDLERWQTWLIERGGILRSIAYMIAWRQDSKCLTDFDTVILSGNEPLWYRSPDEQTLIAYTHATPRFQTDLWWNMEYDGLKGRIAGLVKMAQSVIYQHNVRQPDYFVANSDLVARRMRKYWNIPDGQMSVVYPPVDTESYNPETTDTQDYYLYLGRLDGHKRPDDVVEAFTELPYELRVAGKGSLQDKLERMATENIQFEGFVSEQRKRELLAGAKALVYPCQNEDFGMVPIEAMAAGTPVLGVAEGFTKYQVQEGKNGLLWDRGELTATLHQFESGGVGWDENAIATFATQNFGVDRFQSEMQAIVEAVEQQTTVKTDFETPTPTIQADD